MDVGAIGQNTLGQLLGSLPKQSAKASGDDPGFQSESFSLDISIQVSATSDGQVQNVQDLMDKLKQWVHDLFTKNGIQWQDLTPEEAEKKLQDGGDESPDAVSKRILDFVKGFDDGTPGRAQ